MKTNSPSPILTDEAAARNASRRDVVRWYLMIYPDRRKGLVGGLEREIARRRHAGEPDIEFFAPVYVEAKETGGRIVSTEKQLFFNYVFVHASENELFRLKKHADQYNLPKREFTDDGAYHYPYVSDDVIRDLRWIARSYSGVVPVYTGDASWLVKGDRVKITKGRFKGVEAQVFDNHGSNSKEIMVVVDKWMNVPLLHVKEGEYKVVALRSKRTSGKNDTISDTLLRPLHDALCRHHEGGTTAEDRQLAENAVEQLRQSGAETDVMRCKQYSQLLMAYTILGDTDRQSSLLGIIHVLLPVIKAGQSLALLLVTLYGCTDNSIYHDKAHRLTAPWRQEKPLKKSKQRLLDRLADYDRCLGH